MPEFHTEILPDAYRRICDAAAVGYEGTCYYDREGYLVGNPDAAAFKTDLHYGGRHTAIRHAVGGHAGTVRGLTWPRFPKPCYNTGKEQ